MPQGVKGAPVYLEKDNISSFSNNFYMALYEVIELAVIFLKGGNMMKTFGEKVPSWFTYMRFRIWFAAMRFVGKLTWNSDSKLLEKLYDLVWELGEFRTKYGFVWEVDTDGKSLRERIVSYGGDDCLTVTKVFKDWYVVK